MSDINILLLGETGTGKSTFINALPNYLRYQNLPEGQQGFIQLIPTVFEVTSTDGNVRNISTGMDSNEILLPGITATQQPLIHNVTYVTRNVKLIDTPGMGDTRGLAYDELNVKKIFKVIERLKYLNAICVVLKPNDSRLNTFFNYCINNILSQFNFGLRSNILFLFTNSRGTHFTPGHTSQILKASIRQMESSGIHIPFKKENTFCVDNETFRYLVAKSQGVKFPNDEMEAFRTSWKVSSNECKRLLEYCMWLPQSLVQIIVSLRDSKLAISKLATPLVEIMILHQKSIDRIKVHKDELKERQNSIDDLKSKLYIPVIQYKTTKKIITDSKSGGKVKVGTSFIKLLTVGAQVQYRNTTNTHTEEYIEPYETQIKDASTNVMLASETKRLEIVKEKLEELETMQTEYDEELKVIVDTAAKFVTFLNENAGLGHNHDPFQQYIEEFLHDERKCCASSQFLNNLELLLTRYKLKRRNLSDVTIDDIQNAIASLLRLNHAGPQFRQLYNQLLN